MLAEGRGENKISNLSKSDVKRSIKVDLALFSPWKNNYIDIEDTNYNISLQNTTKVFSSYFAVTLFRTWSEGQHGRKAWCKGMAAFPSHKSHYHFEVRFYERSPGQKLYLIQRSSQKNSIRSIIFNCNFEVKHENICRSNVIQLRC